MGIKIRRKDMEPMQLFLRRAKKVIDRSGILKELRDHAFYTKPSEKRRSKKKRREAIIANPKPPVQKQNHDDRDRF